MISLRDYQKNAVQDLVEKSIKLLNREGNKKLVLKSPTGSGKTIIMAEYLKQMQEKHIIGKEFSFIWAAPRKLHEQSKEKLERFYSESRVLICSNFYDLIDKQVKSGEILFLNWESINKEDNIYIRENEEDFNLSLVIEKTRDLGRMIVLIIDESHHTSDTENSHGLIQMINPILTVNVSATPSLSGDDIVIIQREDVIHEGMIKKTISINPGFKNAISNENESGVEIRSDAHLNTDEFVLEKAIQQRNILKEIYQSIGSNINPLLLIQLPDQRHLSIVDYQDEIQKILQKKHNITVENKKLAIYLSEDKKNLIDISKNNNEIEVMIFKQAIALGWDCPRASILAMFRDWSETSFSTQTLGRIMRMPELKHYEKEELNIAYLYTTGSEISIIEDLSSDYITIYTSKRNQNYKDLGLRSAHSKRFREETRLSPVFIPIFLEVCDKESLVEKINLDDLLKSQEIISDGTLSNVDIPINNITKGNGSDGFKAEVIIKEIGSIDIQILFDKFIIDNILPFYPEDRSLNRIKSAIYEFFSSKYQKRFTDYDTKIQQIVLSNTNKSYFINALNEAKEKYQVEVGKANKQLEFTDQWEVPNSLNFNNNYRFFDSKKSILNPFYININASKIEFEFMEFIDKNNHIEWWFKNGARDATYFAVPYLLNGNELPFYVDWIIKFLDGRVGLFDTKIGFTASTDEAVQKSNGLYIYITEENIKGKNLFGGIITKKDNSWRYFDKSDYKYNIDDLSNWSFLE